MSESDESKSRDASNSLGVTPESVAQSEALKKDVTYVSIPLLALQADREFPGDVYLCLHHKMVKYRNRGDFLEAEAFNKLVYNHVRYMFIADSDRAAFDEWIATSDEAQRIEQVQAEAPEAVQIAVASEDQRRAMMDIFASPKDDRQVKAAIETSKKLVTEFLRKPFAVSNIQAMQSYSKGCVDHSVNVSVLSVFLGLRLGYSHQLILENLAMGGLFHDVGKVLVQEQTGSKMINDSDPAMQNHPKLGAELLEKNQDIPNEVRLIVAQHHEFLDGSGYPNKLKGLAIYDLARLVTIANIYDNLISESKAEALKDRAAEALAKLETQYEGRLDPKKLEKSLKILKYSFL